MAFEWSELGRLLTQAIGFSRRPRTQRPRRTRTPSWPIRRGTLALVAGILDDETAVELIRRAGGRRARVVVVPAAHLEWSRAGELYARYFRRFGVQRVEVAEIVTRERCNDRAWAGRLQDADLVCAGGGDAGLLVRLAGGTLAERALATGLARGTVVALCGGTAAAAGSVALDWDAPHAGAVRRGLGLLPNTLVDGDAVRRGELGRLFQAITEDLLAVCLDRSTGLICGPGTEAQVCGRGAAVLVDGRQPHADLALAGIPVRVLPEGWRVDLASRMVLPPAAPGDARRHGRR